MPITQPNSTNYEHPNESNLVDLHKVMTYNLQGEPILRTSSGSSATATDAFGRLRVSSPLTLYESYHRYRDNGKVGSITAEGASSTFNTGGWIDNTVTTTKGSKVVRETLRVFAYQPGKSLQMLISFNMAPAQSNLRQRVGMFDTSNGIFLQLLGSQLSIVKRSTSSGVLVETVVNQQDWNIDPLDGTGISTLTIDITKSQLFWTDVEWLGVGSVRCGFVFDGQYVQVHTFHHANYITGTYMQTACLPGRIEIEALDTLQTSATYKQICFSVISEGGYDPRGRARGVGHSLSTPRELDPINTLVPLLSIRIKSNYPGSIVIPKLFSIAPIDQAAIRWQILEGTTTGGTWTDSDTNGSSVEYNLTPTGIATTTQVYDQGYIISTNQSSQNPSNVEVSFRQQLQRNTLTTPPVFYEYIIAAATTANTKPKIVASLQWEEIT